MGFLIRIAVVLGIVILFIPADEAETKKLSQDGSFSIFDTFELASSAYSDAGSFCDRNARACATGHVLVSVFEAKARTGARWLYSYLDPAKGSIAGNTPNQAENTVVPPAPVVTGSVAPHQSAGGETLVTIAPRSRNSQLPLPPLRHQS